MRGGGGQTKQADRIERELNKTDRNVQSTLWRHAKTDGGIDNQTL